MFWGYFGNYVGQILGNILGAALGKVLIIVLRTVLRTVLTCLRRTSLEGGHVDAAVRQFTCVNIHMWRRVRDFLCSNKFAISTR
jgi:hypothetical protein